MAFANQLWCCLKSISRWSVVRIFVVFLNHPPLVIQSCHLERDSSIIFLIKTATHTRSTFFCVEIVGAIIVQATLHGRPTLHCTKIEALILMIKLPNLNTNYIHIMVIAKIPYTHWQERHP